MKERLFKYLKIAVITMVLILLISFIFIELQKFIAATIIEICFVAVIILLVYLYIVLMKKG